MDGQWFDGHFLLFVLMNFIFLFLKFICFALYFIFKVYGKSIYYLIFTKFVPARFTRKQKKNKKTYGKGVIVISKFHREKKETEWFKLEKKEEVTS